jgi:ABC-type tungstate transport system permease subunit
MKKLLIIAFALTLVTACQKNEEVTETNSSSVSSNDSKEESLMQDAVELKNSKGETLKVTYFAQGNDVALKMEKEGEPEQILVAKKISSKGEPVFTNEKWMWEGSIGEGGKLSDAEGNSMQYLEIPKAD